MLVKKITNMLTLLLVNLRELYHKTNVQALYMATKQTIESSVRNTLYVYIIVYAYN